MEHDLEKHHEKIDHLIAKRKEQHEFIRKHTRLITATAACFTVGILILGIFYSMLYLPIATEKVNQKLNSDNTPLVSPQSAPNPTEPTATWKTYTSKNYNYSIKYPSAWTVQENDSVSFIPPGADLFPATQKNTPGAGQPPPNISIRIVKKILTDSDDETRSPAPKTTLTVNGVNGTYYKVLAAPISWINFDLPTKDNKQTIRFSFPITVENFSTFNPEHKQNAEKFDEAIFKTIIQSFKFVE